MLRIAGIEYESETHGPGLSNVLFCQGCLHHCELCQNPQTWDLNGGMMFSEDDIARFIKRNKHTRRIVFSGGEPFLQAAGLVELTKKLDGYSFSAYTGYTFEELWETRDSNHMALLSVLDVLVDGPFVYAEISPELPYQGSSNQRILNVPESIKAGKAVLETGDRWRRR